jgi:hypothetical protein
MHSVLNYVVKLYQLFVIDSIFVVAVFHFVSIVNSRLQEENEDLGTSNFLSSQHKEKDNV